MMFARLSNTTGQPLHASSRTSNCRYIYSTLLQQDRAQTCSGTLFARMILPRCVMKKEELFKKERSLFMEGDCTYSLPCILLLPPKSLNA